MEIPSVDMELSLKILDNFNAGKYDNVTPIQSSGIPGIDGETVLDMTKDQWELDAKSVFTAVDTFKIPRELIDTCDRRGDRILVSRKTLRPIGLRLYPLLSVGVLNGGSATSYLDTKKNRSFHAALFNLYRDIFDQAAERDQGKPKGVIPAYVNPDGSPGFSFMELRMRNLLIEILRFQEQQNGSENPLAPLFQMTSIHTDTPLAEAYEGYRGSPALQDLIDTTGVDICSIETAVQPLITAYTHSREGRPKRLFTGAWTREGEILPIPGGHGQNFMVLAEIYRKLHRSGKRFVSLCNVDNLGNTPDPVQLALLCLSGRNAGFEFSFKTPVDVKGGILLLDQRGRLNCGDIGVAVSRDDIRKKEEEGIPILFNCASGIFDLEYLVNNLDRIIEDLPTRFSDQEKDAGTYSQAEQVTWEVIGMIDSPLIFSVRKYNRFLASKLLIENLLTSGLRMDDPGFPVDTVADIGLKTLASRLHTGFSQKMSEDYGMDLRGDRWTPVSSDIIRSHFRKKG